MSALVFLPLLLLSTACRATLIEAPQAGDAATTEYRLPKDAVPLTYDLSLEPDLKKFTFVGSAVITIHINNDVNDLLLNAKELNITKAVATLLPVTNTSKSVEAQTIAYTKEEFVTLTFATAFKKGSEHKLEISYSGILNDEKRGFYRSRYMLPDGSVKYIATTHFEPTGARRAFPCWDEPEYKAIFNIKITHPTTHTAISNMPQASTDDTTNNTKITTFKPTKKMSTYLVAFVVSDYDKKQNSDGTFRVWTKPHAVDQTQYAFDVGQDVLKKLKEYTGIDYYTYMEKMDQISIKDFTAGAMENWGLVTYRETALLYETNVTTTRSKQSIATIIAHEFAHQWFGNLVSPKWWKYIWLNEGFANYFQYYIMDQLKPEWRLTEVYVTDSLQGQAMVVDAGENTRPINKDVDSPSEISNLFDRIAYEKAGSIIRMMSHILTPTDMQKGLQNYLNDKKLSVADSNDLLEALQNATTQKFDKEFKEIMDTWITKPGYPVVTVTRKEDKITLSQERFTLHGAADNTKWWVPITFVQKGNPNFTDTTPTAWLNPEHNQTELTVKKDEWVIVNVNQAGFYRVNYDNDNWNKLSNELASKDFGKINPLTRAQLLDDVFAMARTGRVNYTVALSLSLYLTQDSDYIPWNTAFRNLNFLDSMLQTTKDYPTFQLYIRYLTKQLTKDVKYEPDAKDNHVKKIQRINSLKWACKAEENECIKYVKKAFTAWVSNSTDNPLDPDLKNGIICAGLRTADETKWNDTLQILMASTKDKDEQKSLQSLLGCSGSRPILKKFLLSSLEPNATVDFITAVQAVLSDHAEGVDIVLEMITQEQETIKKMEKADDKVKTCIEALAQRITNKDQFLQLTIFSAHVGAKPELVQSTVQKGIRNMEWMDAHSHTIGQWLTAHKDTFNSATTLAFTSLLMIFSIFVTRFY